MTSMMTGRMTGSQRSLLMAEAAATAEAVMVEAATVEAMAEAATAEAMAEAATVEATVEATAEATVAPVAMMPPVAATVEMVEATVGMVEATVEMVEATVEMVEATVEMVEATVGIVEAAMTKSSHPQSLQFPRDGVKKGKSFYPSIHISWIVLHAACFLSDFFLRDF